MTGPEHFREAERLLAGAMKHRVDDNGDWKETGAEAHRIADALVAEATVHAALAQAAATAALLADRYVDDGDHINAWRAAIGEGPTAPIRCTRCGNPDGPFVGDDPVLCEACPAPLPLAGAEVAR